MEGGEGSSERREGAGRMRWDMAGWGRERKGEKRNNTERVGEKPPPPPPDSPETTFPPQLLFCSVRYRIPSVSLGVPGGTEYNLIASISLEPADQISPL